jgi:hypothetical protein
MAAMDDLRRVTAIDIACRRCAKQPGEHCMFTKLTGYIEHAERVEDAASMSSPSEADPQLVDEAFGAVVDEIA